MKTFDERKLAKELLALAAAVAGIAIGNARPVGGGFSIVDGKRCRGYAIGRAIALKEQGAWRVFQASRSRRR
jgi:hypothetical protein